MSIRLDAPANREHSTRRRSTMRGLALVFAVLTIGLLLTFWVRPVKARPTSPDQIVARGQYLVTIGACNDCHTPFVMGPEGPEPDMSRMLSGHPEDAVMPEAPVFTEGPWVWVGSGTNTAFAGPWGVSYAFNLTPDQNTGIGAWTEEIFVETLRTGRHWGVARPILPPMPWQNYREMTDEDLQAVYAYLRSVPPVHNRVPEARPSTGS